LPVTERRGEGKRKDDKVQFFYVVGCQKVD